MSVLIKDHEFLVHADPNPAPAAEPNVLDTVSAWWGLGSYQQIALRWAAESGGAAYVSDMTALRGLAADGLVVEHDGSWSATDAGRALLEEAAA